MVYFYFIGGFGMEKLRELRKNKGLTISQVGKALGLRNQYISNYELGKRQPSFDILKSFAEFYNVSIDYLLEYNPNNSDSIIEETADTPYGTDNYFNFFEELKSEFKGTNLIDENGKLKPSTIKLIKNLAVNNKELLQKAVEKE